MRTENAGSHPVTVHDVAAKAGVTPSRIWQVIRDMKMKPRIVKVEKDDGRKHRTAMFTIKQARGIAARLGGTRRAVNGEQKGEQKGVEVSDWKLSLAKLVASLPDDLLGISIERNGREPPRVMVRRTSVVEERISI